MTHAYWIVNDEEPRTRTSPARCSSGRAASVKLTGSMWPRSHRP